MVSYIRGFDRAGKSLQYFFLFNIFMAKYQKKFAAGAEYTNVSIYNQRITWAMSQFAGKSFYYPQPKPMIVAATTPMAEDKQGIKQTEKKGAAIGSWWSVAESRS